MAKGWRLAFIPLVGLIALALALPAAADAAAGPPLEITDADIDSALTCNTTLAEASSDPVLLTPAFSTAEASYGWNYLARLPKLGIPTCSITVPDSGYGDLQRTAEYVVASVRRMSRESGRDVILLGHQHGALDELWALTFWPDVARKVSDLISLATPYNGTSQPQALCGNGAPCAAATRQITAGSAFIAALAAAPVPGRTRLHLDHQPQRHAHHAPARREQVPRRDQHRPAGCLPRPPGEPLRHPRRRRRLRARDRRDRDTTGPPIQRASPPPPAKPKLMPDADPIIATVANGFLPIFLAQNAAAAVPPSRRPAPTRNGATRSSRSRGEPVAAPARPADQPQGRM